MTAPHFIAKPDTMHIKVERWFWFKVFRLLKSPSFKGDCEREVLFLLLSQSVESLLLIWGYRPFLLP